MSPLVWIGGILVVLWLVGWLVLKVASGLIHLVLLIGVAVFIWGLVKKGTRAMRDS